MEAEFTAKYRWLRAGSREKYCGCLFCLFVRLTNQAERAKHPEAQ